MANLTTSADILDDVLFRAGEPTDGTSDFHAQTVVDLNRAYRAIWMGGGEFVKEMNEPWLWLKKDPPGVLTLEPIDEAGTVTVTNNNASITFSGVKAGDLDGWFFKVQDHPDVFRISAHTAGSDTATLDSVYTGPTGAGKSFRLFKLEYALAADLLRLISPMRSQSDNQHEVEGVDLVTLDRDYPLLYVETGTPELFALVTEGKVRFNKCGGTTSTDLRRLEYDYLRVPSDLSDDATEPLVPKQYRQVLSDITLFYLFTSKSDARAEPIGVQAKASLSAMAADNRARMAHMSRRVGSISPRPRNTARFRRVLRTSSGIIIG